MTGPARTWTGSSEQWARSRLEAAVYALDRRGLPLDLALPVARALLGQWWIETDAGAAEYDYNLGNMHAGGTPEAPGIPGWHGAAVVRGDDGAQVQFRAYGSLADGLADYLQLLEGTRNAATGEWSGRYRGAWEYLLAHPSDGHGFYQRVLASGYSTANPEGLVALYDRTQTLIGSKLGPGARGE